MRGALTAPSLLALGAPAWAAPLVVTAPQQAPAGHDRPRIFLSGSIDMGRAADWQADLIRTLGDPDVVILNPRRPDWNPEGRSEERRVGKEGVSQCMSRGSPDH